MSEGGSRPVEADALASQVTSQVELLERETCALQVATRRGRRMRLILFLAIVVFLGAVTWAFWGLAAHVKSQENLNEIAKLAQRRVGGTTQVLTREAKVLAENAQPVLTEALQKALDQRMPEIRSSLDHERELLIAHLQERLQKEISKRQEEVFHEYIGILVEEFPEAADEKLQERMVANLQRAMEDLIAKYYVDEFTEQFNTMYEFWEDFPIAEPVREGDLPLVQQLYGNLWELFNLWTASTYRGDVPPRSAGGGS